MKKYLTREESKKLIESGISPDCASFVNWIPTKTWNNDDVVGGKEHIDIKPFRPAVMGFENFDCQDVFSTSDLINILPDEIDGGDFLMRHSKDWGWNICYMNVKGSTHMKPELIDVLYEQVLWYINRKNN